MCDRVVIHVVVVRENEAKPRADRYDRSLGECSVFPDPYNINQERSVVGSAGDRGLTVVLL